MENFWQTSPAETIVQAGLVISQNPEYFAQFEDTRKLVLALTRAVVDRKFWDPVKRYWARTDTN